MSETEMLHALIDELREENRQLKEILLPVENPFYGRIKLTPQLAALLNAFYRHDALPHARLDAVIAQHAYTVRGGDYSLVYERARVAVCKLRAILRPHEIEIEHMSGMGYRMSADNKRKLEKLMEGWT